MKNIYLAFNSPTKRYILAEDPNYGRNRIEWSNENGLVKKLREFVDSKRKSILYLDKVPEEDADKVFEIFKETKVTPKRLS